MVALQDILPEGDGFLPYYMAFISLVAIGNSAQCFSTLYYSRRIYNGLFVPNTKLPPKTKAFDPANSKNKLVPASNGAPAGTAQDQVTPLTARLFGTWTLMASLIRIYAAYHLKYAHMYDLALWSYVVALCHFGSELLVFKTLKSVGAAQAGPFIVTAISLVWMPLQRSHYVQFP